MGAIHLTTALGLGRVGIQAWRLIDRRYREVGVRAEIISSYGHTPVRHCLDWLTAVKLVVMSCALETQLYGYRFTIHSFLRILHDEYDCYRT
jgi:hypothetical protein